MAREKSYIFNWVVEASKRPEMIAFPDNTPRFGFVEAYDHFLHVSRTNPFQAWYAAAAPDPGPRPRARFLTQAGHSPLSKLGIKTSRRLRLHVNQFQT